MGVPIRLSRDQLLDLGFFVNHMLADHGIVLFDLHFRRHGLFVFVGCIKMTGTGGRYQADFISCHDLFSSDLFAARAQFGQNGINAFLINNA